MQKIGILGCAILSLCTLVLVQHEPSQQKEPSSPSHQATAQERNPGEASPVPVSAEQGDKKAGKDDSRAAEDTHQWRLSDEIAIIASLVGFLQFLALVATWGVMRRYGRRQLRAYLLPEKAGLLDGSMLNPPQPARALVPGAGIVIKNYGQTPAYSVLSWFEVVVGFPANEGNFNVPQLQNISANTLGPGVTFSKSYWFDRNLTQGEINDIAVGTRLIYIHGRIEYRDAFGKRRYTNFRLKYGGQFPPPNADVIFHFCDAGNDAN